MKKILIFLVLNFGALAIGGLATSSGVVSDWYRNLNQAPWTPPGFVFGAAWTFIMVCFTFYIVPLYKSTKNKKEVIILYILQWFLNVLWNPIFFHFRFIDLGLVSIISLTVIVAIFFLKYKSILKLKSILILPYLIWLMIATSLNLYISLYN